MAVGRVIFCKVSQLKNAFLPIFLIELGRVTVNKLSQLANAPSLMASGAAPSAKSIFLTPVLLKPPIVFILGGKVTVFSRLQPEKELLLRLTTPSLKITSVNPLFRNAPSLIVCTPPGIVTFPNELHPSNA